MKFIAKIGFIVGLAVLGAGLGMTLYRHGLDSSETASWIQAIGAILAIIAAVDIGQRQMTHTRKIEDDLASAALKRKWSSVKALVDDLYQQCIDQEPAFENEDDPFGNLSFVLTYKNKEFDLAMTRVAKIPLFELDSDILVREIINLQHYAKGVAELVDMAQKIVQEHPDAEGVESNEVKHYSVENFAHLKEAYTEIHKVTGGDPVIYPRAFGRGS